MRSGRLRARKPRSVPAPTPARVALPEVAPIARTSRERLLLQDSLCLEAERLIQAQPAGVRAAVRASIRARLRARGTDLARAYTAHRAALAGRSHDADAAAAWRGAVVAAGAVIRDRPCG